MYNKKKIQTEKPNLKKMDIIDKIDKAIVLTQQGISNNSFNKISPSEAFLMFLSNNDTSLLLFPTNASDENKFTARDYMQNITKEEFFNEMLKEIYKYKAYSAYIDRNPLITQINDKILSANIDIANLSIDEAFVIGANTLEKLSPENFIGLLSENQNRQILKLLIAKFISLRLEISNEKANNIKNGKLSKDYEKIMKNPIMKNTEILKSYEKLEDYFFEIDLHNMIQKGK